MIALTAIIIFSIVAAICYVAEHIMRIARATGIGYLIYHSDSQKTFYSVTYRDALEWMGCAIGDACLISNRTGEAVAIRFASK